MIWNLNNVLLFYFLHMNLFAPLCLLERLSYVFCLYTEVQVIFQCLYWSALKSKHPVLAGPRLSCLYETTTTGCTLPAQRHQHSHLKQMSVIWGFSVLDVQVISMWESAFSVIVSRLWNLRLQEIRVTPPPLHIVFIAIRRSLFKAIFNLDWCFFGDF